MGWEFIRHSDDRRSRELGPLAWPLAALVLWSGLSTLLVSKLLKNPFGKVVAYEYQVTGSWDNPQVSRLSAPPGQAAANPPAAPARTLAQ